MSKIKIISTLGPGSFYKNVVRKMDLSGVDLFRINLSHTKSDDFVSLYKTIKSWTDKPICPDTEGAQLRTGSIVTDSGKKEIKAHENIEFVGCTDDYGSSCIPLSVRSPAEVLRVGDLLKIDFDSAVVQITHMRGARVCGRVLSGGVVGTNKGISVDRPLYLPSFTEKDVEVLKASNRMKVKTIFLSFCSCAEDVRKLRRYFDYKVCVISKIESELGLRNLIEICHESDEILIDRGDITRDVPLEKVAFAQSYILKKAGEIGVPVNVATNLMENMIEHSKPTRAEINDIVTTLQGGASGLVLAAETAIGKHPVESVRIMKRIISEVEGLSRETELDDLFSLPSDRVISPHGGILVQQHCDRSQEELARLPCLRLNENELSDIIQIAEGTYSPLTGFMNLEEIDSVLSSNKLLDGNIWTLPIILQLNDNDLKELPKKGLIAVKSKVSDVFVAVIEIATIERFDKTNTLIDMWFGGHDERHPGVKKLLAGGDYILSGKPFLLPNRRSQNDLSYALTPKQTRDIFNHNGWRDIVGFHTRNAVHRGHEYIQESALVNTEADAILISPVGGPKKMGDFSITTIIRSYQELIRSGAYDPYGVLLASFDTYSRYSGPREAVFTAICRKNFGCNYFIVGRDHTGVGAYYEADASKNIFDRFDLGITILAFEEAAYCSERDIVTTEFNGRQLKRSRISISGTEIRDQIKLEQDIPENIMSPCVSKKIKALYKEDSSLVFEQ